MSKRELARTWASRTLLTARAGLSAAKVAGKAALERARDAATLDPADAEALVERLDELKGLSMKIGQMASLAHGPLPPRVQAALERLQAGATGLDPEAVRQVIADAYGRPPEEVFEAFEPTPFAAASIGQVHRARIDGREVAVKVQYPGVEDAIEHDVRNLAALRFLAVASSFSTRELVEELRERLREECDYLREAACQAAFRAAFADRPEVLVPEPLLARCRRTVLVTEYVDGRRFAAFRDGAPQAERDRAGVALFTFAFRAIFEFGAFNGDPHPGNYLFPGGDRVCFLDFGCVRRFDPDFVARWKHFARVVLDGDEPAFRDAADALGIVGSARYDYAAAWESFRVIYRPMLAPRFRFTNAFAREAFDALAWKNPNLWRSNIPPALAFSWRLNWGLFSVLAALEAEGDFATPFRAAVEAPLDPRIIAATSP